MKLSKHKLHENKESFVKEATEHIVELKKVPHSKDTYGKCPKMQKVPRNTY